MYNPTFAENITQPLAKFFGYTNPQKNENCVVYFFEMDGNYHNPVLLIHTRFKPGVARLLALQLREQFNVMVVAHPNEDYTGRSVLVVTPL